MTHEQFFLELTIYTAKVYTEIFETMPRMISAYYSNSRFRDIVDVRNIIFAIAHKHKAKYLNDISCSEIAGYYGKDHSLIYNAKKLCSRLCDSDKLFKIVFDKAEEYFMYLHSFIDTPYNEVVKTIKLNEAIKENERLTILIEKLQKELLTLK